MADDLLQSTSDSEPLGIDLPVDGQQVRRQRRRSRRLQLLAIDLLMLGLAILASSLTANVVGATDTPGGWIALYVVVTLGSIALRGGYEFRLRASLFDNVGVALIASALAAVTVISLRVLVAPGPLAAEQIVRLFGFSVVYLGGGRLAHSIATQRIGGLRTLIIGAGTVGQKMATRLLSRPELGLVPVGFLDKEPLEDPPLPILGASWDLEQVIDEQAIDHVVVTFSRAPHHVLLGMVRTCRRLGVEISVVPRLFEEVSTRLTVEHVGGVALFRVAQADPRGWQFEIKYALDRAIGVALLILSAPLMLALALLVRLSSPGPILFRQERVGLDGKVFDMLKFRTMHSDAGAGENDAAWAARALGQDADSDGEDEPVADRRTPVGKFLRRWSLDELPQVVNVARGDMSLVGPRPERTGYVRAFEQHVYRYDDRHRVKSGLTGWAQVNGLRGDTPLDDRVEWDNYYVENWSPWLDLKILMLTPWAVFGGRGAG